MVEVLQFLLLLPLVLNVLLHLLLYTLQLDQLLELFQVVHHGRISRSGFVKQLSKLRVLTWGVVLLGAFLFFLFLDFLAYFVVAYTFGSMVVWLSAPLVYNLKLKPVKPMMLLFCNE